MPNHTPELFAPQVFLGAEIERMKSAHDEERGQVYTRPEVVHFILDLAGYTPDKPLWKSTLLEPSFGSGDFLLPAIERLIASAQRDGKTSEQLMDAIHAVELHRDSFEATRERIHSQLEKAGFSKAEIGRLTERWLVNADFLLEPFDRAFDFVVGNPPYVRQESIPAPLLAEYRNRFATLYDRADLYVPFIERSLQLLGKRSVLAFICSDRWMKNRYGGPLREMVSDGFTLKYYVDMVDTAAFQSEVIAYPAITVIQRGAKGPVRMAHRPEVSTEGLARLCQELTAKGKVNAETVQEMPNVAQGGDPWLLEADAQPSLALVRRLEAEFPTLEEAGCRVGIGVATGADKVFIGPMEELDVEEERKLPLAMTRDLLEGEVCWRGLGVVNPFEEDGSAADLSRYPRFAKYIHKHGNRLKARHCAKRRADFWYRTIDRITPELATTPKLLIPDIKGGASVVYEEGQLYPHHNLYYIVSQEWPLEPLQAVLMSGIAHLFVRAYSTKMHGGCLRFQAQYLRRIRLPRWSDVSAADRRKLNDPSLASKSKAILSVVGRIYGLSKDDMQHLDLKS